MATVLGVSGRQHPEARANGYRDIVPGRFVFKQYDPMNVIPKHLIRQIPTVHQCPYCHDPLCRLHPGDGVYTGRVVQELRGEGFVVDPLPDGVIPLKCVACDVHFSVLENRGEV